MARYEQTFGGERRTEFVGIKLTPTERLEFETDANAIGVPLSTYMRDLCVRRRSPVAANAVRRSPDIKALMNELSAIGNNINQLAKHANSLQALPTLSVLQNATDALKEIMAHVLEL